MKLIDMSQTIEVFRKISLITTLCFYDFLSILAFATITLALPAIINFVCNPSADGFW
jgi:hypothetical protein